MNLSQIHIYRMTHIENIPHILVNGITHKNSTNANISYVSIGDTSLITKRATKQVAVTNGNRSCPIETITLGNFIPFYFEKRMPMLYVMQYGGNGVEKATPPENIVYVVCKLTDISDTELTCYFSNGHATDNFTLFYDNSKINDLPTILNWSAINSTYWGGENNLEVKRQKQAELLVSDDIPANLLKGFVCYNEIAQQRLLEMQIAENKITVDTQAYY